jgi:hypothetical protein
MLHDLFMLQEYFEPPQSLTPEKHLLSEYGVDAVMTALKGGYLKRYSVPCANGTSGECTHYYMLTDTGSAMIRAAYKTN